MKTLYLIVSTIFLLIQLNEGNQKDQYNFIISNFRNKSISSENEHELEQLLLKNSINFSRNVIENLYTKLDWPFKNCCEKNAFNGQLWCNDGINHEGFCCGKKPCNFWCCNCEGGCW